MYIQTTDIQLQTTTEEKSISTAAKYTHYKIVNMTGIA